MSDCPDDNLLVAYGAGALADDARVALEQHLDGCEICRTLAAEALQQDAPQDRAHDADAPFTGAEALGPGAVLGRYVVLARIGAGGMGTVYSAYDPKLERRVALKLLHAEARTDEVAAVAQDRLLREAQAMARLTHPNVVSIFDVGTWRDRVFLAMEFVDGGTLRQWFAQEQRTQPQLLRALIQAGRGLQAAHEAGLVHRDFKPDNVLVSTDGRVLVTDFGLAHAELDVQHRRGDDALALPEIEALIGSDSMSSTQTGALVGTPAYMAPEQLLRQPADARSDQFAFCVAAWEALCGKRPFELDHLSQLAATLLVSQASVGGGSVPTPSGRTSLPLALPPGAVRLPGHVLRALQQGLRIDPERRHASLEALLTQLEADPAARRRTRWTMAAVGLTLLVGAGSASWQWNEVRARRCSGGPGRVGAAWGGKQQAAIAARFENVAPAFGADSARRVAGLLDEWGQDWASMHRDACEATRVRDEQSERVLSLRMACLDRRLQETDGLVRLLQRADETLAQNAPGAVLGLPSLSTCADVAALLAPVPPPEHPAERAKLDRLSEALAHVRAQFLAGQYADGLAEARVVWSRAKDVQHPPTRAEAALMLGHLLFQSGEGDAASTSLRRAVMDGDRGKDDALRAEAAIAFVNLLIESNRLDEADEWGLLADAALDRLGTRSELRGSAAIAKGRVLGMRGRPEDAIAAYQQADRIFETTLGSNTPKRTIALANQANELYRLGRFADAERIIVEAIAIDTLNLGADHPTLVPPISLLAALQSEAGAHDAAIATIERAEHLVRTHYPRTHRRQAWVLDTKATILQGARHHARALEVYRQALTIKLEILPKDDPDLAYAYAGIGQNQLALGRAAEAIPNLEEALRLGGPDPIERGDTRFALARALASRKQDASRVQTLVAGALDDYAQAKRADKQEALAAWRAAPPRQPAITRAH